MKAKRTALLGCLRAWSARPPPHSSPRTTGATSDCSRCRRPISPSPDTSRSERTPGSSSSPRARFRSKRFRTGPRLQPTRVRGFRRVWYHAALVDLRELRLGSIQVPGRMGRRRDQRNPIREPVYRQPGTEASRRNESFLLLRPGPRLLPRRLAHVAHPGEQLGGRSVAELHLGAFVLVATGYGLEDPAFGGQDADAPIVVGHQRTQLLVVTSSTRSRGVVGTCSWGSVARRSARSWMSDQMARRMYRLPPSRNPSDSVRVASLPCRAGPAFGQSRLPSPRPAGLHRRGRGVRRIDDGTLAIPGA